MNLSLEQILLSIENSGWLAPVFFILFHVFRQVLFIPVLLVCLVGGYLFGIIPGTIYSVIGMTAVSFTFYFVVHAFPKLLTGLRKVKTRWLGEQTNSLHLSQLMIIRLMPFIHFHLTSLYLIETTKSKQEYMKLSFYTCIPAAFTFTAFGHVIRELPPIVAVSILVVLGLVFYLIGRRDVIGKWSERVMAKSSQ
ncbi:VTT domain-containing protein [Alkalihalobacillus sp. LMS39]|uniref:TVP38/TMEM64 family protein n=1 Tax=Alkalihalobacillus sp. LMS39 TaxID=2924032 RepID=UPI001FB3A9A8|nr:VTT domain-containing protein [Alkalihalobacillus sp. LMS39]UOE93393.1 VTT domain-containing protein [Alkalihalobacillus sp. LMS39]